MVSDGMSHGMLNMADLLLQRKEGSVEQLDQIIPRTKGQTCLHGYRFCQLYGDRLGCRKFVMGWRRAC